MPPDLVLKACVAANYDPAQGNCNKSGYCYIVRNQTNKGNWSGADSEVCYDKPNATAAPT